MTLAIYLFAYFLSERSAKSPSINARDTNIRIVLLKRLFITFADFTVAPLFVRCRFNGNYTYMLLFIFHSVKHFSIVTEKFSIVTEKLFGFTRCLILKFLLIRFEVVFRFLYVFAVSLFKLVEIIVLRIVDLRLDIRRFGV